MKPEQQRIAIAEACGMIRYSDTHWLTSEDDGEVIPLPDYLNDLNAMHDAEKVLNLDQWHYYKQWLGEFSRTQNGVHATAAQKAEAFLRTLNR